MQLKDTIYINALVVTGVTVGSHTITLDRRLHWPFLDPAVKTDDEDRQLARFREVRDMTLARVKELTV